MTLFFVLITFAFGCFLFFGPKHPPITKERFIGFYRVNAPLVFIFVMMVLTCFLSFIAGL